MLGACVLSSSQAQKVLLALVKSTVTFLFFFFKQKTAYEIENSTSIYSGLLRFADLNIIAPNTLYPMFIVAPKEKKGRLREQLRRPTFKRLGLDKKVRFLSYEAIDDIDQFFSGCRDVLN